MTSKEVKDAVIYQRKLVWNDPDPIEGNDYTVQKVWNIDEESAMIHYGSDDQKYLSEAEVPIHELALKQ